MTRNRHVLICCTALCLAGAAGTVVGAASSGREAFFRCKDAQGLVHFGDSMPPECMGRDTEVLSDRGNVVRVIEGTDALAARAERKIAEDAANKAKAEATMRDRMLVEAYLSVKEIENLRDQRMGLIDAQMRVDEQNLNAYKDREQRLLRQVQRYRPYSNTPNAQPIPDHMAEDMVNLIKSRDTTNGRIANRMAERKDVENKFASDIQRFKELKGIK